jgi:transposase-like protein
VPRRGGLYAGRLRLSVIPDRTAKRLVGFVRANVQPDATVVTDGWSGYAKLVDEYEHIAAVEDGDPDVAEQYLPLIHLIFSNLKAWLNGVHHGVGDQHLQAYLNEFTFRFNRRFYPLNAFKSLLGIGAENESPTYAELYSGEWKHPHQVCAPRVDPSEIIK